MTHYNYLYTRRCDNLVGETRSLERTKGSRLRRSKRKKKKKRGEREKRNKTDQHCLIEKMYKRKYQLN